MAAMSVYIVFIFTYIFVNDFVCCQRYPPMMENEEVRHMMGLKPLKHHKKNKHVEQVNKPSAPVPYDFDSRPMRQINRGRPPKQEKYADYGMLDLNDMFQKITKYKKWNEFYERYNKEIDKIDGDNYEKNGDAAVRGWQKWIKEISEEHTAQEKKALRADKMKFFPEGDPNWRRPSIGMEMYWPGKNEPKKIVATETPLNFEEDVEYLRSLPKEQARAITLARLRKLQQNLERAKTPEFDIRSITMQQARSMSLQKLMEMQDGKKIQEPVDNLESNKQQLRQNQMQQSQNNNPVLNLQELPLPELIKQVNMNIGINKQPMQNNPMPQSQNNNPLLNNQLSQRIPPPPPPPENSPIIRYQAPPPSHGMTPINEKTSDEPIVLPVTDDIGSPIRWVNYNSMETRDGLAKVTDESTGRNKQFIINGTIFVPIVDHDLILYRLTTEIPTTTYISISKNESVLRTVLTTINFKESTNDWLAYAVINGEHIGNRECREDGCQARCYDSGCPARCTGDTCNVGCVGNRCSAACKGPGCKAMCIGARCVTQCEGLNCDSRCRGKGCDASCKKLSCWYTVNNLSRRGNGSFDDHYPQYEKQLDNSFDGTDY